jgi:hypothetical protein
VEESTPPVAVEKQGSGRLNAVLNTNVNNGDSQYNEEDVEVDADVEEPL